MSELDEALEWVRKMQPPLYSDEVVVAARRQLALEPDADGNYRPRTLETIADVLWTKGPVIMRPFARQLAVAVLDALRTLLREDER